MNGIQTVDHTSGARFAVPLTMQAHPVKLTDTLPTEKSDILNQDEALPYCALCHSVVKTWQGYEYHVLKEHLKYRAYRCIHCPKELFYTEEEGRFHMSGARCHFIMSAPSQNTSSKFLSSVNGLVPSTIFDRGGSDMDDSEEMEEIREVLYEMIKKNFPMGVAATHLAEKYHEEYVEKGLGRELPEDWLQQVTAAEEFEAQTRGPITILFVRLSNTSSFKRPPINSVNVRVISTDREPTTEELNKLKHRKETEPLEHAKTLSKLSSSLKESNKVLVVSADSPLRFFIRASIDENQFERIGATLAEYYAQELPPSPLDSRVAIYQIICGGAYALQDSSGSWFRVIAKEPPHAGMVLCHFVDVGVCEKFPVAAIRLLPPAGHPVMSVGSMAREVRLDISDQEALNLSNRFIELTFGQNTSGVQSPLSLTVSNSFGKGNDNEIPTVDLRNEQNQSITELLKKPTGIIKLSSPVSTSSNKKSDAKNGNTPPSTVLTNCSFDKHAVIEPMSISQMPSSPFPANAIFAAGPADISLRQLSLDPMPDYMYAKLKEECAVAESKLNSEPEFGAFYAAIIDNRWERVQCIRSSKIDRQAYCVYLLDVGAFQYVRKEAMRKLNATSPFKKMLMFKCKIANIKPIAGDVWSRDAHEAVREFFEAACGEPVIVEPTPNSSWTQWKQLNAPAVPLCEAKLSCCGRDIGEWLIACGLALPIGAPKSPVVTFAPSPTNQIA
ncbi:unnamed protein product [Caenorhabditis bovis]|uniref:Tudor domain-containing protein n=1 Tax=Caenorhabditis bovis TaxID=2654633 RepID=A0A8S1EG52_9PELO|nr:unnamed protein product [Caenorhabditis bovis]